MDSRYLIVKFIATTLSLKCVYTERYNLSTDRGSKGNLDLFCRGKV